MRYQNIESKIWHDEKFLKLSPLQQRLFLYLLTCPHGNFLGIFVLKPSYAIGDLDYSLQNYLKDLSKVQSVRFDPETNVVWIINLLKYSQNYGHWNEKHKKGAIKLLKELPKSELIQEFIKYYKELLGDVSIGVSIGVSEGLPDGITKGLLNPYAISETETETETEEKSSRLCASTPDFISQLKEIYAWIDVDTEIQKMKGFLLTPKGKGRKLTHAFAVRWLNRVDKPIKETAQNTQYPPKQTEDKPPDWIKEAVEKGWKT